MDGDGEVIESVDKPVDDGPDRRADRFWVPISVTLREIGGVKRCPEC